MKRLMPTFGIHYEEELPSDSQLVKESEARAQATLARAEKMKMEALMLGKFLRFSPKYYIDEAINHFAGLELIPKEGLPNLKRGHLPKLSREKLNE